MKLLTPDVKVKAEPALMYRWAKSAEMYYAGDILLPWELVPKNKKGKAVDWEEVPVTQQTKIIDRLNYLCDEAERIRKM